MTPNCCARWPRRTTRDPALRRRRPRQVGRPCNAPQRARETNIPNLSHRLRLRMRPDHPSRLRHHPGSGPSHSPFRLRPDQVRSAAASIGRWARLRSQPSDVAARGNLALDGQVASLTGGPAACHRRQRRDLRSPRQIKRPRRGLCRGRAGTASCLSCAARVWTTTWRVPIRAGAWSRIPACGASRRSDGRPD
jgi:hypothetical protein